jgi:hypothetical protein
VTTINIIFENQKAAGAPAETSITIFVCMPLAAHGRPLFAVPEWSWLRRRARPPAPGSGAAGALPPATQTSLPRYG